MHPRLMRDPKNDNTLEDFGQGAELHGWMHRTVLYTPAPRTASSPEENFFAQEVREAPG